MVMLRHYHVRTTTPPPDLLWLCPREAAALCGQAALTAALQAGGVTDEYTFELFYEQFCLTVLDTVAQVCTYSPRLHELGRSPGVLPSRRRCGLRKS